jgi:hypothetical protein
MMANALEEATRRTQRYWYVDGLVEIGAGLVILLLALFYLLIRDLFELTLGGVAVGIGQPAVVILGIWLARKGIQRLKERLTYPRTGYVAYPRPGGKHRLIRMIALSIIVFFMAAGFVLLIRGLDQNWFPAITGAEFCVIILYLGMRFALPRFYLQAFISLLAGLLTSYLHLSGFVAWAFFFALIGLGWTASGGVTLWAYLRHTHPAGPEDL